MSHRGHCHDFYTIQMVKNIQIDKSFLSHSALSIEFGASIHSSSGVEFGKAVMENSKMNIGIYPSKKIGWNSIHSVCKIEDYDLLITDERVSEDFLEQVENNFENVSKERLLEILEKYSYKAITVTLTGDYEKIYQRFLKRNDSPDRHRGHVVNDCYPEKIQNNFVASIPYESFVNGIVNRGMDSFVANGPHIVLDTTDFIRIDKEKLLQQIVDCREEIMHG